MKNTFKLSFLCLVLFAGCELWNQPIISKIEDKLNELRTIHTIFVSAQPSPKAFVAGKDEIPQNAAAWEACGLRVSGTNSLDETRVLTPGEEYDVELEEVNAVQAVIGNKETKMVAVTVRLKDSEVTTSFDITLLRPDEEYYWIRLYTAPGGTGTVYSDPLWITGNQFKAAGEAGVPVKITTLPNEHFILKDGSLASFTDAEFTQNEKKLQLDKNDECIFKQEDFGESGEKEHRTYLYADFERASGVVMLDGKYYATLEEAIDAAVEAIDAVVEGDLPPPPQGMG
jgi:hypothetical protein